MPGIIAFETVPKSVINNRNKESIINYIININKNKKLKDKVYVINCTTSEITEKQLEDLRLNAYLWGGISVLVDKKMGKKIVDLLKKNDFLVYKKIYKRKRNKNGTVVERYDGHQEL